MKKIVLTGPPGAGKSVITAEIIRRFPQTFALVPEAATQVYNMLQTRWDRLDLEGRRDAQRRMYRLQMEQEARLANDNPGKQLLLDRGTVDGAVYWPDGPDAFWIDVNSSLDAELARYDAVLFLDTAATLGIYDGDESNAVRFENPAAAIESGVRLLQLWQRHPRIFHVPAFATIEEKIDRTIQVIQSNCLILPSHSL